MKRWVTNVAVSRPWTFAHTHSGNYGGSPTPLVAATRVIPPRPHVEGIVNVNHHVVGGGWYPSGTPSCGRLPGVVVTPTKEVAAFQMCLEMG